MALNGHIAYVRSALADAAVSVDEIQERSFPGERWIIVFVPADALLVAQSLAGSIERGLNTPDRGAESPFTVVFRARAQESESIPATVRGGLLFTPKLDQLIQLLEARSRTSDALPSLKYVEDPRATLAAVAASRHQLIYGRRGVGKTALLLEAKRLAERQGDVTVWLNAHVFRHLNASTAFLHIAELVLTALVKHGGSSQAEAFVRIREAGEEVTGLISQKNMDDHAVGRLLADLNDVLRGVLRQGLVRLNIYIDDFYLFPIAMQPNLLDYVFAMLRDTDGWLKVASIERLTRPFEPSSKIGLEVPHDASKIDLDVTLEEPAAAQQFLESVLSNYTSAASVGKPSRIAKSEALGRLVLASGGVPRDYLNLFASSIVVARESRAQAQQVGREDVAVAAGRAARGKKRDLEQDVATNAANALLTALDVLSSIVKKNGFTYFRVNIVQKSHEGYEALGQLADLRFVHLIQASLSDQHKGGTRYEAYVLDLSEYTDVRLKRGLQMLDLEDGQWSWRLAGKAKTERKLTGTQLRDLLRQSPLIDVEQLIN
jgi:hypothetical protein